MTVNMHAYSWGWEGILIENCEKQPDISMTWLESGRDKTINDIHPIIQLDISQDKQRVRKCKYYF